MRDHVACKEGKPVAGQPKFRAFSARADEDEELILARIAAGHLMKDIAADYDVSYDTLRRWCKATEEREALVQDAKEASADALVEDAMSFIDGASDENPTAIRKAEAQAGFRKWLAAKRNRQAYGDDPAVAIGVNLDLGELHLEALRQRGQAAVEGGREVEAIPASVEDEPEE